MSINVLRLIRKFHCLRRVPLIVGRVESAVHNLGLNFSMVYVGVQGIHQLLNESFAMRDNIIYHW